LLRLLLNISKYSFYAIPYYFLLFISINELRIKFFFKNNIIIMSYHVFVLLKIYL